MRADHQTVVGHAERVAANDLDVGEAVARVLLRAGGVLQLDVEHGELAQVGGGEQAGEGVLAVGERGDDHGLHVISRTHTHFHRGGVEEGHGRAHLRADHERHGDVARARTREEDQIALAHGRHFDVEGVLVVLDAVVDVRAVQLLARLQTADHRRLDVLHERHRLVLLREVEVEASGHQLRSQSHPSAHLDADARRVAVVADQALLQPEERALVVGLGVRGRGRMNMLPNLDDGFPRVLDHLAEALGTQDGVLGEGHSLLSL